MPTCKPRPCVERSAFGGWWSRASLATWARWFSVPVCSTWISVALGQEVAGFHSVTVNGLAQSHFVLLFYDDASRPYVALKDFMAMDFAIQVPPVRRDDLELVPLFGLDGMQARVDARRLTLALEVGTRWYAGTQVRLNALHAGHALAALPGALLNYSLQVGARDTEAPTAASSQNLSFFGTQGLLEVATALTSVGTLLPGSTTPQGRKFSRLGTRFVRDDEERLTTLWVGDGVSTPSVGVPGVRFGGVSWQSNFGLDPAFSTLETPAIFDAARLPSTLEFFLNDRRVGAPVAVAPGPFEVSGLPTVDGAGQVRVLIRDALNNERVVSVPYLHTARLYRQGVHSFRYTAGLLRPDLEQYDTPFLSSSHRWGLTRWLTLDAGANFSAEGTSLGAGATFPVRDNVVGDANLAVSESPSGAGQQFSTSVQWQVSVAGMGASASHSTAAFRLLGDSSSAGTPPRDDLRLYAARALTQDLGSVSASWGYLSMWDGSSRAVTSLGWSRSFRRVSVSLGGVHSSNGSSVQVVLSVPLGRHGFFSSALQTQNAITRRRNDYSSAPLTGTGVAWRLATTGTHPTAVEDPPSVLAGVDLRSDVGEHVLELESHPGSLAWRASTSGSVGELAGKPFYGPPISSGFALVSTGDASGIPVYRWNVPVAVSNARGLALVTALSPYQNNLLAVRPEDVPLEYRVTRNEVTAVPRSRGGVYLEFAMVREHPALLVLHLPDGQPVPPGTRVTIPATGETASVGLRGEVYLQNLPEHSEVHGAFQGRSCHVVVYRPQTTDPQPRLGPYVCVPGRAP